jgi:hypothetical protein
VADVAPIDDKLAQRIASIIRMFISNVPGDVDAAMHGLKRTLKNTDADTIHAIAERIEHPNEINEADMQKLVDFGRELERKRAEQERHSRQASNGLPQLPPAHAMALFCHERIDQLLKDNERDFINDMVWKTRRRALSPKQQQWLEDIYLRLGGR